MSFTKFWLPLLAVMALTACSEKSDAQSAANNNTSDSSSTIEASNCTDLACTTDYYAKNPEQAIQKISECSDDEINSDIFCQGALASQQAREEDVNPIID